MQPPITPGLLTLAGLLCAALAVACVIGLAVTGIGVLIGRLTNPHPTTTTTTTKGQLMTTPQTETERALHLIASNRHASVSALQRWMNITFGRANNLLNELQQQGWVGPADGSKSRAVYVQYCEQCGRIGTRGFKNFIDPSITVCANKNACRKRWPKPPVDEAP